jgi:YidC/Oxa1 family membrane protein insertase
MARKFGFVSRPRASAGGRVRMIDLLGKLFGPMSDFMGRALELFHSVGLPWWLSIAFLTLMVRVALFPLAVKQVKNMRAMQDLKPEMDEIRSKFKNDRQRQQEALMELYKERRVNPLAGFLPVLVQVPVFITMYYVIRGHEETFPSFASGGLFWFTDLTRSDPYFILPVLSASILVLASEISSRNVNPSQKNMMRFLPVVFTAFVARLPAGLFVYWVTSNTVTLVQNYLIYRRSPGRRYHTSTSDYHTEENLDGGDSRSANNRTRQSTQKARNRRRRRS